MFIALQAAPEPAAVRVAAPGGGAPGGGAPGGAAPPLTVVPPDFETFYRQNRDELYGYVAGMLRDRPAAEDVTAIAFERAYRKWKSFDPRRGTARGWLFGIARNAALDELRRRRRELTGDPEPLADLAAQERDGNLAGPAETVERRERRATLMAAVGRLITADRELIALKFYAGLTNVEIAEVTGHSATNVGTRLNRAIGRLRKQLGETGEEVAR